MHLVCTFSEDNDLKILNSDVDAVFFADAEMKFGASEKCNTDCS